ncbi:cob(I)yrinic acid a,c-diamide adenosyltransferase [Paenibacillus thermoaerophilus]|uniref:Corrinoid adenosyltransferase n=1 Tax=Paenibacillus thermoaerophilus TaxID=1215385 RepID=A0ABW2V737_9BACL|nr:cob(I)yrinic acid a,c-diamide adenosyltransferase [Paenibacillus thermoaerophilus]TMV06702.1 cob(I)yrinic acid a,c-diamide adenosyltransferase [Paenibacillus thermoaerophilus]
MKIYTRTGDDGQTGIIGGRVDKDDDRVEAYGTVDELNAFVGQAISLLTPEEASEGGAYADMARDLLQIQQELFDCGSDLALAKPDLRPLKVKGEHVDRLEAWIDRYDAETPDITRFILPGGSPLASALHVCRTVCRRAERRVVTLARTQPINDEVRRYLNRLSDLFFTMARTANHRAGVGDVEYERSAKVFRNRP